MKYLLSSLLILSSFFAQAETEFHYSGPFYVDAQKSHGGIFKMIVPRGKHTAIVIDGDDSIVDVICSGGDISQTQLSDNNKTVILKNHFDEQSKGLEIIHILTKNGLTHSFAFMPAPIGQKNSDINVKVIIQ